MSLKICLFVILAQHYLPLYGIQAYHFLYFYAFCIVYSIFNMYEKATIYQWFEEKSLSLHQNQLS